MDAELKPVTIPWICDHVGCERPAVGKYVVGGKINEFDTIVRCAEHAGVADMKEPVNVPAKEGR